MIACIGNCSTFGYFGQDSCQKTGLHRIPLNHNVTIDLVKKEVFTCKAFCNNDDFVCRGCSYKIGLHAAFCEHPHPHDPLKYECEECQGEQCEDEEWKPCEVDDGFNFQGSPTDGPTLAPTAT